MTKKTPTPAILPKGLIQAVVYEGPMPPKLSKLNVEDSGPIMYRSVRLGTLANHRRMYKKRGRALFYKAEHPLEVFRKMTIKEFQERFPLSKTIGEAVAELTTKQGRQPDTTEHWIPATEEQVKHYEEAEKALIARMVEIEIRYQKDKIMLKNSDVRRAYELLRESGRMAQEVDGSLVPLGGQSKSSESGLDPRAVFTPNDGPEDLDELLYQENVGSDPCGTIAEWRAMLDSVEERFGPRAYIFTDAGANNVQIAVRSNEDQGSPADPGDSRPLWGFVRRSGGKIHMVTSLRRFGPGNSKIDVGMQTGGDLSTVLSYASKEQAERAYKGNLDMTKNGKRIYELVDLKEVTKGRAKERTRRTAVVESVG